MKHIALLTGLCLLTACHTRKTAEHSFNQEEYFQTGRLAVEKIQVPGSVARLTLPVPPEIRTHLPADTAFRAKSGRATIRTRLVRDTLYLEASCDSLSQLVWRYETELQRYKATEEKASETKIPFFYRFALFALAGILLLTAFRR